MYVCVCVCVCVCVRRRERNESGRKTGKQRGFNYWATTWQGSGAVVVFLIFETCKAQREVLAMLADVKNLSTLLTCQKQVLCLPKWQSFITCLNEILLRLTEC